MSCRLDLAKVGADILWPDGCRDEPELSLIVRQLSVCCISWWTDACVASIAHVVADKELGVRQNSGVIKHLRHANVEQVKPQGRAGEWVHKLTLSGEEQGKLELRTPKLRWKLFRVQFQAQASRASGVQFNYR